MRLYEAFFRPGEVTELRALDCFGRGPYAGWAKGIVSGYFDDGEALEQAAMALEKWGKAKGIYFCIILI